MSQRKGTAARSAAASAHEAAPIVDSSISVSDTPSLSLATDPLPTVKVNKYHLAEIKTSLDDIVKKYLTDQAFTPSHLHATVHLVCGYASCVISLGAFLYTYLMGMTFEESKPYLWIGVIAYGAFQSILWGWKRWVERGEVFRGRRRRVVKRIETDLIQIHTSTSLLPPPEPVLSVSPNSRPSSPVDTTSPLSSPVTLKSSPTQQLNGDGGNIKPHPNGPTYLVHLTLSTTSNNGKSLIHKALVVSGKPVGEVVDENGGVEEGEVTRWISGLLNEAGLVDVEDEGLKEE